MDGRAVQLLLRAGPEELRLRRQPDLDHPEARRRRVDFSAPVLHGAAGGGRAKGSTPRRPVARRPEGRQARRPDRHDQPRRRQRRSIKPTQQPKVFNDSNDVVTALKQGQVDAVVVDLPTAFYLTAAQVPRPKIVGQFDAPGGDEWGALLEGLAADRLRDPGARRAGRRTARSKQMTQQWMGDAAGAPELTEQARPSAAARSARRPGARRRRRGAAIAASRRSSCSAAWPRWS